MDSIAYSYSKIISDDNWGLLEIIPNKPEPNNTVDIIKVCEDEKEDIKPKTHKLSDANFHIRKNVLKGFGSK